MRTFIIKARKGTTRWEKVRAQIGAKEHFEVICHSIMNAFFLANDFRLDTEMYIILDSSDDFPRTIKLTANEGLSFSGFCETAIIEIIEKALKNSMDLQKDQTKKIEAGVEISGFGFEKLIQQLFPTRTLYLLGPKGQDIREANLQPNPVFILSDHLAMPKKIMQALKRQGLQTLSMGKQMLFASQCVTLLNYEMDRANI